MNGATPSLDASLVVAVVGWTTLLSAHLLSRLAIVARLLPDKPNERSSHETVTPRSGGGAMFFAWALGMGIIAVFDRGVADHATPLVLLAGFVFLFGLADDVFGLKPLVKFALQIAAAAGFVVLFGAYHRLPLPGFGEVDLGVLSIALTVAWIVGFMNVFNFMDGVNGIAAGCGALALLGLAVAAGGAGVSYWAIVAALAGLALCGFLPVNFPGGRLFMGDNGSQTFGFLIAAVAVAASNASVGAVSAWFVPTLMAPFLFDVAFTLFHRLKRGQNVLSAHREHLYQLLLRLGLSQIAVTSIYLSATAFCAAAAFLMLALAPRAQCAPPAIVAILMLPFAVTIYRRARREELLPDGDKEKRNHPSAAEASGDIDEALPGAAE